MCVWERLTQGLTVGWTTVIVYLMECVCVCVCFSGCSSVSHSGSGWENSSHTSAGVLYHTVSCLITLWFKTSLSNQYFACVCVCVHHPPWVLLLVYKITVWINVECSHPDCAFIVMLSVVRPWRVQRHGSDERTGQESDSAQRMALSLGSHPKVRRAPRPENWSGRRGHLPRIKHHHYVQADAQHALVD